MKLNPHFPSDFRRGEENNFPTHNSVQKRIEGKVLEKKVVPILHHHKQIVFKTKQFLNEMNDSANFSY